MKLPSKDPSVSSPDLCILSTCGGRAALIYTYCLHWFRI